MKLILALYIALQIKKSLQYGNIYLSTAQEYRQRMYLIADSNSYNLNNAAARCRRLGNSFHLAYELKYETFFDPIKQFLLQYDLKKCFKSSKFIIG